VGSSGRGDVSFYYNMRGNSIGIVDLETSRDRVATWTTRWGRSGNQGAAWRLASFTVGDATVDRIRFSSTTGAAYDGDISIDDVVVTSMVDLDEICAPCEDNKVSGEGASFCYLMTSVSSLGIQSTHLQVETLEAESITLNGVVLDRRRLLASITEPGSLQGIDDQLASVLEKIADLEAKLEAQTEINYAQQSELDLLRN
jgi:hypothetical protein